MAITATLIAPSTTTNISATLIAISMDIEVTLEAILEAAMEATGGIIDTSLTP
jgi:hypothetical protein